MFSLGIHPQWGEIHWGIIWEGSRFSMCGSSTVMCLHGSFRIDPTGDSIDVSGSVPNTVNFEGVAIEGGRTL